MKNVEIEDAFIKYNDSKAYILRYVYKYLNDNKDSDEIIHNIKKTK